MLPVSDQSLPEPQKPARKLTLQERIEANRGAGYGAMLGAVAGAILTGPFAPLGAAIGGALGGGLGSLIDRKWRRKKSP